MYLQAIKSEVRKLRRKGHTFREILESLPFLSKSTVSNWVKDIKLTSAQKKRILENQLKGRVGLMNYNKQKHQEATKRAQRVISEAKREIGKLTKRDLLIAGTALYWAEGSKRQKGAIDFANSNPKVIALMMRFFREICRVPENKLKCRLTLHPGISKREAKKFWSKVTNLSFTQFTKPYTKPPKSSMGKMHNILYHGTCQIRFGDIQVFHKIQGFIKALGEKGENKEL